MNGLNENTSLLGDTEQCNEHFNLSKVKSKFKSRRCCLWSSKAALLILTWNLIVSFSLLSFFDPSLYQVHYILMYSLMSFVMAAVHSFFSFILWLDI